MSHSRRQKAVTTGMGKKLDSQSKLVAPRRTNKGEGQGYDCVQQKWVKHKVQ
jgi:hypothetical protein